MIQSQLGAQINSSGAGIPASQPTIRTGLRPQRSDRAPAARLAAAFVTPKATMNVRAAVTALSPKVRSASRGSTVRSWPIIPPTSALTPTSRENWPRFSRRPSRTWESARAPINRRPPPAGPSVARRRARLR